MSSARLPRRRGGEDAVAANSPPPGGPALPTAPPAALPPIRLRDWEIPGGYAVAAFIAVIAVMELTITHGKGAAKSPNLILPAVGLAAAIAQAVSIRWKNRILTAILGIIGGGALGYAKVPDSLALIRTLGLFVPFIYGFVLTQRQSRAQRALQGPRVSRKQQGKGTSSARAGSTSTRSNGSRGSKGSKGQKDPEPTGPRASRRYTPPKPKEERSERRRR